ncbi:DMT family transporter [Falsiroseomonas selenitidurans]|uniref:DMT family transporter n=1 Tax=Falsiroseomonas selenitidurans TaxID=2716335 RepID=A0ABX1E214_9PROT|nr:DMT family transporter [Falsiroseomonas selenitidurans]NKC29557.1 DMT family transporter [Falsiroseomonas selenitidurans]
MSGEAPTLIAATEGATLAARERRVGYACAFAVLFVWAGFLISARLSASQAITPWDVAALRYAGAFLGALPLVAVLGVPRLPPWRLLAILAMAAFGFPILAYHGFTFAPASHGGVMLPGTLPFLTVALGAAFLGERWTRRRVASLLVVAAGIGLLASDTFGSHPGAWRGDLLFLAGSCCWAVYTLLIRLWGIGAMQATLSIALWSAPIYLPVWWLLLPSTIATAPPGGVVYQLAYQGVAATLLAGLLFTRAVTALGAPTTTAITALVPGLAALAAWPLLDEPLGMAGLAGVALVSAGMILAVIRPAAAAR